MALLIIIGIVVGGWLLIQALKGSHALGMANAEVGHMSSQQLHETHHIATGYLAAARLGIIQADTSALHESIAMAHATMRRVAFEQHGVSPPESQITAAAEVNVQKWITTIEALPPAARVDLPRVFSAPATILALERSLGVFG